MKTCPTCNGQMTEKPLFSSTYWECSLCEKLKVIRTGVGEFSVQLPEGFFIAPGTVEAKPTPKQLQRVFANTGKAYADDFEPANGAERWAYLSERGWIKDQGYYTMLHEQTGEPVMYHMKKLEDCMRLQKQKNKGLDNYSALQAGKPYSWEKKKP